MSGFHSTAIKLARIHPSNRRESWLREDDDLRCVDQAGPEADLESETAVRDLEMSPVGQAYVVARSNFEKLMAKVNQQISEGMEKGATSSIITLG